MVMLGLYLVMDELSLRRYSVVLVMTETFKTVLRLAVGEVKLLPCFLWKIIIVLLHLRSHSQKNKYDLLFFYSNNKKIHALSFNCICRSISHLIVSLTASNFGVLRV